MCQFPLCLDSLFCKKGIIVLNSGKACRTLPRTSKHSNAGFDSGNEDNDDAVLGPGDVLFLHGIISSSQTLLPTGQHTGNVG